jgi:hypothetical protein
MPAAAAVLRDLTTKDKAVAEAELAKAACQIEELKKEVDLRIAAFLKEEQMGQDKVALFNVLQQEVRPAHCWQLGVYSVCSMHWSITLAAGVTTKSA